MRVIDRNISYAIKMYRQLRIENSSQIVWISAKQLGRDILIQR